MRIRKLFGCYGIDIAINERSDKEEKFKYIFGIDLYSRCD